jgi:hypothetical protein
VAANTPPTTHYAPLTTYDPPPTTTEQVRGWKRRLAFESENFERLERDELRVRVRHSYEQCVACLRFYPEIWLEYVA